MGLIWELVQPFIGYIGLAVTALLALWGKSKLDKRKGRIEERTRREAADAKKTIQAHKDRENVEDRIARDGDAKQRLRDRWRKP